MLENKIKQLKRNILTAVYKAGKGHIGGALSSIDIMAALFYGRDNWDFTGENPNRDRFILSKGHSAIALYTILEDYGVISKDDLYQINSGQLLGEHPDNTMPGIEIVAGSLGHGLGIASGLALSLKKRNSDAKVFCMLGDGECYEGSIWESALFAAHHQLTNLTVIVDRNNLAIHGNTEDINKLDSLALKFINFGWDSYDIGGSNVKAISDDINERYSWNNPEITKPLALICQTTKGKGVSFMENNHKWHHGSLTKEQYRQAMAELS